MRNGECYRGRLTKRHANDSLGLAALAGDIADGPVEAIENDGGRGRLSLEDLDRDEGSGLSNTIGSTTDGTGNVGTVTNGVDVGTANSIVTVRGSGAELSVRGQETSVDDVGIGASTS